MYSWFSISNVVVIVASHIRSVAKKSDACWKIGCSFPTTVYISSYIMWFVSFTSTSWSAGSCIRSVTKKIWDYFKNMKPREIRDSPRNIIYRKLAFIRHFMLFSVIFVSYLLILSFSVLAKARAALQDLVYVLWQNNLRLFKKFRSPEESKILLKTQFTRNRLMIANFHWIFTDSCHICWFRVSVFWQKHELLCGIWCKFCDKTIWDYLKIFEVLRNPRFSRKHNSP